MLPDELFISGFKNYKLVKNKAMSEPIDHIICYGLFRIEEVEKRKSKGLFRSQENDKKLEFVMHMNIVGGNGVRHWSEQVAGSIHIIKCFVCKKKIIFEDSVCLEEDSKDTNFDPDKPMACYKCINKLDTQKEE